MKWKPVSSRYRYCISRFSRMATSTGSSARNVLSRTRPVLTFFSLVRTKAPPLPGLTCWNSTTFMRSPSMFSVMPFFRSLVVGIVPPSGAGGACRAVTICSRSRGAVGHSSRSSLVVVVRTSLPSGRTTARSSIRTPPKPGGRHRAPRSLASPPRSYHRRPPAPLAPRGSPAPHRSSALTGPHQVGRGAQRQFVAAGAEAGHHPGGNRGDHQAVPPALTRVHVRQVHLDHRDAGRLDRVAHRVGGVCQRSRVEQHRRDAPTARGQQRL